MHEIVSGGGKIEFVLLEYCSDEELRTTCTV